MISITLNKWLPVFAWSNCLKDTFTPILYYTLLLGIGTTPCSLNLGLLNFSPLETEAFGPYKVKGGGVTESKRKGHSNTEDDSWKKRIARLVGALRSP